MELALTLPGNKPGRTITLPDESFGRDFNEPLVHQTVVSWLAGARRGTAKQKTRSEAHGGGRKPWRQKGTGRSRAGTIRSPIWRGGGRAFAARPRNHAHKLNRKMYRAAMSCILSELIRQERLIVVDEFTVDSHKTRELLARLKEFGLNDVLIVSEQMESNLSLAARNLHRVETRNAAGLDPVSLVGFEKVLITVKALEQVGKLLT